MCFAQPTLLTLANVTPQSGPTALVVIPQHSTATLGSPAQPTGNTAKGTTIVPAGSATIAVSTPHVTTLPQTTQSKPIQLTATTNATNVTNTATAIPMTAFQQQTTTIVGQSTNPTLATTNRTPTTLPILSKSVASPVIKPEPTKFICCLLDNGIRCDRIAGNASFSARIQKIVATKKMNFALDPTVRHTYICEHHKAIITVAKKSTAMVRENKSRGFNSANNNQIPINQTNSNFNDLSMRQNIPHSVNLDTLNNQNNMANNHTVSINNVSIRQGNQITYSHYQGAHANQLGNMDVMMSTSFDNSGGDTLMQKSGGVDVDLQQLQVNTLRRYKKHFRVQTRPGLNKMQLAEVLKCHFRTLPIIEKEAITYFVYIVKCYRNKLDQNPKAD